MAEHVSRELLERFFRLELSRQDAREVVLHLMHQCEQCLEAAVEVGAVEGYVYAEGEFRSALFAGDPVRYQESFLRLLASMEETQAALAEERLRGIGLWHALEKHDQERRIAMILEDPRMQTWGLYDRLLEKGRDMSFRAPVYAGEIAQLALTVTATLDPDRYGAGRIVDFRAGALALLGNTRRLASDFAGAEACFRLARIELSRGTGDPLEEASLLSLEASLHKDLGEFELAVEILDQTIAIYREMDDAHLEGRALLKQADAIGYAQPEKAIQLVQEGLARIDPLREPRLEWCARHTLALFLNDAGKSREALAMLDVSRSLYAQFKDPWTQTRLHWLEGKISRSLGDLAGAEETFKRLWFDLQEPAYAHELTLLSIDLAEVYVARGKHEEALDLVEEFVPLLREWGMHTEGLALWLLMQKAVEEGRAESALFRGMAEYLHRAWHRPLREGIS